jgi:hypothetical protein
MILICLAFLSRAGLGRWLLPSLRAQTRRTVKTANLKIARVGEVLYDSPGEVHETMNTAPAKTGASDSAV